MLLTPVRRMRPRVWIERARKFSIAIADRIQLVSMLSIKILQVGNDSFHYASTKADSWSLISRYAFPSDHVLEQFGRLFSNSCWGKTEESTAEMLRFLF